ncbi:MAG: MBL fold metallo-hydrolase [Polyangia bacterium]
MRALTAGAICAAVAAAAVLCVAFAADGDDEPRRKGEGAEMDETSIRVLYDNRADVPRLRYGWGLACLVRKGETSLLFDTGSDGGALLSNMELLQIDPSEIDGVVLSHAHWDHVGGLPALLKADSDLDVHMLESFPGKLKRSAERAGARVVEHGPLLAAGGALEEMRIAPGLYTTGELAGSISEQALVIETDEGPVMVTGCSHPGIGEMVEKVSEVFGALRLVLGGFHLFRDGPAEIRRVIEVFQRAGVERAAPIHCTGKRGIGMFAEVYGERFVEVGTGTLIEL